MFYDKFCMKTVNLYTVYKNMLSEYGNPVNYWPQWCADNKPDIEREKVVIGMILVQRTTWHNANIALKRLKDAGMLSIRKLSEVKDISKLTEIIRPAGFFQSKPQRLLDVCSFTQSAGGVKQLLQDDLLKVRGDLLQIKGVGKETADTILLYALDKPVFIIDEYTYRWADKNGIKHNRKYEPLQEYFQKNLQPDTKLFRDFHTLIIVSQRGREKSGMEIV